MKLKSYILFLSTLFILSSCAVDNELVDSIRKNPFANLQLRPDAPEEKEIKDITISYIIPNYVNYISTDDYLTFHGVEKGIPEKQEHLFITRNDSTWSFERRTDNGAAGSGRIFDVEVTKKKTSSGTKISFVVKKERTYQQGVVLPFPIPEFDIKQYLATAVIKHSFELDSKYDKGSVKANFDRLLEKSGTNKYILKTDLAFFVNKVEFYPYRGGTKIIINSTIHKMQGKNCVIKIHDIIKQLEVKTKNVVDA